MDQELNKIELRPAREQVAIILKRKITNHELLPGEKIDLRRTAAELGVSSMPVREALQILNNEGLVELHPNKPAIVLGISKKHLRDFYETYSIIEKEAAGLAALRNSGVKGLEKILEEEADIIASGVFDKIEECNEKFHHEVRRLSDNDQLIKILDNFWATSGRGPVEHSKGRAEVNHKDHISIYSAIKKHDVDDAKSQMEKHIKRAQEHTSVQTFD